MRDVIVVGAGAAGLMAARELKRAGKRVIVLEASRREGAISSGKRAAHAILERRLTR